jgi:hypothetical protein
MVKPFTLIVTLLCLAGIPGAFAKIFRVGYVGKAVAGVDFSTFDNNVITAASNGDTIQLYQNNSSSAGTATITKKLVFIGFGYLLDKNPGLQATPQSDTYASMYFNSGSEGSIVQGLNITYAYIAVNDITISRCRINAVIYLGYNALTGQQPAVSNINIWGNYIVAGINDYGQVTNLFMSNNIFLYYITLDNSSGLFANNFVINYTPSLNSFVVKNNIFANACVSSTGSTFNNNLFSYSTANCPTLPTGNGNQFSVNMANVFTNWNGGSIVADNQLTLKAGSPAIGAGVDGNGNPTDAGPFGGASALVYKLSGIPAIPAIYQLTAPGQTTSNSPYTITVSIRSNN